MIFGKKKNKGAYPHSFAKRLTWRIMLRMLIIMGIPVVLLFFLTYLGVVSGMGVLTNKVLEGEVAEIRRITSDLYVAANNTAPSIREHLDNPDKMYDITEQIVKLNPYIRSCGISFREGYYPAKGRHYSPYALRDDSNKVVRIDLKAAHYNYLEAKWFREAIGKKEGIWSSPYIDTLHNNTPIVSYLLPIRDRRDSTVAVLGVDLSLDWLNNKIQLAKAYENEDGKKWNAKRKLYYFMTDSMGTILMHPSKHRIARQKMQRYMSLPDSVRAADFYSSSETFDTDTIENEEVFVNYDTVKYTNWTMALVIPQVVADIIGYVVASLFILFIVLGMLVVYVFGRRAIKKATKPLSQLAASADEVAKGHFDTALPIIKTGDEIHLLRDSFENMQQSLTKYVAELREATAQKAAIENEMKVAHNIQMSMLPKTFPPYPNRDDIDIFGTLKPAKAVGGDLFDFYIHNEQLVFCIGDVSGKGVPASLFMAVTRSLFRNITAHELKPHHIVKALNESLSENNDLYMFVTLFVGVLDLQTGLLRYCNAGHDAPLLIGNSVGTLPCNPNLPIGVMPDWQFTLQQVTLDSQTTIFLYTDGLNEAENILHAQFGDDRIISMAETLLQRGQNQPSTLIQLMTDAVHDFVGQAEQSDDLTMLAIQYKK